MSFKPGTRHTVTIEKLVFHGSGLGTVDGMKLFVQGAVPGDTVICKIAKKKRRYATAKVVEFITKSPQRTESICTHFPDCGGCQLIDIPYAKQLEQKREILDDCIAQFYPELAPIVDNIVPAPSQTHYRNKMEFAFGQNEDGITIGLKKRGQFDTVIPITECHLQDPHTNTLLKSISNFFNETSCTAWNYETHTGDLRHVMMRHSKTNNNWMLMLITGSEISDTLLDFVSMMQETHPEVVSIYQSINTNIGDTPLERDVRHLHGEPIITETLGEATFSISPESFFQTNTVQATKLYQTVVDVAQFKGTELLLDLYCGTGTIGLFCSPYVKKIIGIEEIPAAVEDASKNAQRNGISNAEFYCGRVKNILKFQTFNPDVVVIDPPRAGMVPKALQRIINLDCKKLVYVSCNPVTLLRDLKIFSEAGYTTETIIPVDMFPNTFHIECVARLTKK
jgi:23S rRNA (uracil1939-C5)-methyltransferase